MTIATRTLVLRSAAGDRPVEIVLHQPRADGAAFACDYHIDWPEGRAVRAGHGADHGDDAMQALVIALQMIGVDLYTSAHHRDGRLVFAAPGGGYGFPVTQNCRDMLVGEDARAF